MAVPAPDYYRRHARSPAYRVDIDVRVILTALTWICLVVAHPYAHIAIDWLAFWRVYAVSGFLFAMAAVYTFVRPEPSIATACFSTALLFLFSTGAGLLNYMGLAWHRPLVDEALHRADLSLGLDWWAYVSVVKGNRSIADALTLAYQSSLLQIAAAVVFLGLTGRKERLERMTFAFMLSILVAIAVWTLFPSFGALPLRYAEGYPPPPFHLVMDERYVRDLIDLHAGKVPPLTPSTVNGLIGFPSVHAVWAALMIYSFWGVRWLGPVALAANILVLISTPADGGHHFIDVFAGLGLAYGALLVARLPTSLRLDARAGRVYAAVEADVSRPISALKSGAPGV